MEHVEQIPMLGLSLNAELPGKRNIVIQGHVERDGDVKALNAVLDKMREAMDRQFAFGMRDILKRELEQQEKIATDHAVRMAQVDINIKRDWGAKKGDPVLSKREQDEQQKSHNIAESIKLQIAKIRADIAANEAIIGA
jgi:hypothetical protein